MAIQFTPPAETPFRTLSRPSPAPNRTDCAGSRGGEPSFGSAARFSIMRLKRTNHQNASRGHVRAQIAGWPGVGGGPPTSRTNASAQRPTRSNSLPRPPHAQSSGAEREDTNPGSVASATHSSRGAEPRPTWGSPRRSPISNLTRPRSRRSWLLSRDFSDLCRPEHGRRPEP
jgi:hypothetical protein